MVHPVGPVTRPADDAGTHVRIPCLDRYALAIGEHHTVKQGGGDRQQLPQRHVRHKAVDVWRFPGHPFTLRGIDARERNNLDVVVGYRGINLPDDADFVTGKDVLRADLHAEINEPQRCQFIGPNTGHLHAIGEVPKRHPDLPTDIGGVGRIDVDAAETVGYHKDQAAIGCGGVSVVHVIPLR